MTQKLQQFMRIFQKIEVFAGLNLQEIQQLLTLCHIQSFEPDQVIYKAGDPSSEMLILLHGQLVVTSESGGPIGSATSGVPMGEMGVFTGQKRSANVIAVTRSGGVTIRKVDIEALMARNPGTHIKILRNIVSLLSKRLQDANDQNGRHLGTILRLRDRIESAEVA